MSDEQPQTQESKKPPKGQWEAKEPFFDLKASHWVQIVLTVVLGCIAYAQYSVYNRQAGIMESQANIADAQNKLAIQSNRAFLTIHDIHFIETPPNGTPNGFDLMIQIKNSGRSIGQISTITMATAVGFPDKVFEELPAYRIPNPTLATAPIIPDAISRVVGFMHEPPITPISHEAMVKGVLDGSFPFWVYGIIKYDTGYRSIIGETGYCAKFNTQLARRSDALPQFQTCGDDQKKYTYVR
jgi:hypothetical protein